MVAKEAANAERAGRRGLAKSPATSPKATAKHAEAGRASPTPTTNAETFNADQSESSRNGDAASAVVIVEPHEVLSPGAAYDKGENSRVSSLRRQFELLTARYEASDVVSKAAKLAADVKVPSVTRRSSRLPDGTTSERRLGDATRRCFEMGNRIGELEGENFFCFVFLWFGLVWFLFFSLFCFMFYFYFFAYLFYVFFSRSTVVPPKFL